MQKSKLLMGAGAGIVIFKFLILRKWHFCLYPTILFLLALDHKTDLQGIGFLHSPIRDIF